MPPLDRSVFPDSARSKVWRTVVGALKSDPTLQSAVDTWQTLDNSAESLMTPTEENLPLVRITPAGGGQGWLDENAQQSDLLIKIEIGVPDCDTTFLFDMWSYLESVLFNGNTLLNALEPFGVIEKVITSPAFLPRLFGGKAGLAGEGILRIKMRINS